jgi:hypothetical protein
MKRRLTFLAHSTALNRAPVFQNRMSQTLQRRLSGFPTISYSPRFINSLDAILASGDAIGQLWDEYLPQLVVRPRTRQSGDESPRTRPRDHLRQ